MPTYLCLFTILPLLIHKVTCSGGATLVVGGATAPPTIFIFSFSFSLHWLFLLARHGLQFFFFFLAPWPPNLLKKKIVSFFLPFSHFF